jgi:hypothetical protein
MLSSYTTVVGKLLEGYSHFGNLSVKGFLDTWYGGNTTHTNYPPLDGSQLGTTGKPIDSTQTLIKGMEVDHFGGDTGMFLSPAGTLYYQHAIPLSNLNDVKNYSHSDYYKYKVVKNFNVLSGPIAGNIFPVFYLYFECDVLNAMYSIF